MKFSKLLIAIVLSSFIYSAQSQETEVRSGFFNADLNNESALDTTLINQDSVDCVVNVKKDVERNFNITNSNPKSLFLSSLKSEVKDVQQRKEGDPQGSIFLILIFILLLATCLKLLFNNDFESIKDFIFSFGKTNNLFKSEAKIFSLSSVLLSVLFIVCLSVYVEIWMESKYVISNSHRLLSILSLVFLFTFFFLIKIAIPIFVGNIFQMKNECERYLYNSMMVIKTVGIAMIPLLFILITIPPKYLNAVFFFLFFLLFVFLILYLLKSLSTSYNLMYKSLYHFLIYVCVAEVLIAFLFIKLLIKTVN